MGVVREAQSSLRVIDADNIDEMADDILAEEEADDLLEGAPGVWSARVGSGERVEGWVGAEGSGGGAQAGDLEGACKLRMRWRMLMRVLVLGGGCAMHAEAVRGTRAYASLHRLRLDPVFLPQSCRSRAAATMHQAAACSSEAGARIVAPLLCSSAGAALRWPRARARPLITL